MCIRDSPTRLIESDFSPGTLVVLASKWSVFFLERWCAFLGRETKCNRVVGGAMLMGRGRLCVAGSRSVVGEYRLGFEVVRCNSGSRVSWMTSHLELWRGSRCFNIYSETTVKPKGLRGSTTVSGDPSPYCT